jgi:hypothetical protein
MNGRSKAFCDITHLVVTMKYQQSREPAGMVFFRYFLHQAPFGVGYWCYDRRGSVRLVIWNI